MPEEPQQQEAEGLPPGAVVRPLKPEDVEGLPPGAILKPIQPPAPTFNEKLTRLEPWSTRPGILGHATTALSNLGAGAIGGAEGTLKFAGDVLNPNVPLKELYEKDIKTIPSSILQMGKTALAGHPEYPLGQLAGGAAVGEAGALLPKGLSLAGKGVNKGRYSIGGKISGPEGELTPGVKAAAQVGGGLAGGLTAEVLGEARGAPVIGGYLGYRAGSALGPQVVRGLFPEDPAIVAKRAQNAAYEKTGTELMQRGKEQATLDKTSRVEQARAERAAQKAADEAESFRNQQGEDRMQRQREQDALDREETRTAREAKAAREQPAEDLMRRGREQDVLDRQQQKALGEAKTAREQPAEDLMRRQKQQDALDKAAQKASKDAQAARDKSGEDLMQRQKQQDAMDREATRAAREAWTYRPSNVKPAASGRGGITAPTELQGNPTPFEGGVRPSPSEVRVTELIRKPILTPEEASFLERQLGPNWKLKRGQGITEMQASQLGTVRARRAARGMREPE